MQTRSYNIVHLIFTMEVGGAENLLVDIANNQAHQAQVSVIIVNDKFDKNLIDNFSEKIRLIFIRRKEGSKSILSLLKIWRYLIAINPRVIHCHQQNLVKLLPFWRTKTVVTIHDVGIATHNLKKYKRVFAISKAVYNDLYNRCGLHASIIHNGILVDSMQRKSFNYINNEQPFKIVQISRLLHKKKGQHVAIGAIKRLVADGYTNVRLYFIGAGPSLFFLKKIVEEEKLEEYIFFLGEKDRNWIYNNLKNYDLLLQPSIFEGFGLTIIEGISAGLPVIASNIDGPAEILHDMPSGFLFKTSDEADLALVLLKVLRLNKQNKLMELCKASYEIIRQKYSVKQTADNYLLGYAS